MTHKTFDLGDGYVVKGEVMPSGFCCFTLYDETGEDVWNREGSPDLMATDYGMKQVGQAMIESLRDYEKEDNL